LLGGLLTCPVLVVAAVTSVSWKNPSAHQAIAQTSVPVSPERVIDRLALALTNKLPSADLKERFVDGQLDMEQAVEELVNSNDFLFTAGKFWLSKMKITGVVDFENIKTSGGATVLQAITVGNRRENSLTLEWVNFNLNNFVDRERYPNAVPSGYFRLASDFTGNLANISDDAELVRKIENKAKVDCSPNDRRFKRNANRTCPSPYNSFSPATAECKIPKTSRNVIAENVVSDPWFGSSSGVQTLVCPGVVERCGSRLEKCFPSANFAGNPGVYNGPVNVLLPNLREDFTFEPGILAAAIIRDNRPWEEVLRSTGAPITGTMESFLSSSFGSRITENMPPGSYRDKNGEPALSSARGYQDRSWTWKERGALHAGVLTTMAFQKSANGWRAKSATAMEAFLCRAFVVPTGVAVLPSEEADLTRRPYCQSCHSVLEPLSLFFGRWPNVGNLNYFYDPGSDKVASGVFDGVSNADTNGLAKIFTSTRDFHDCAVSRAFEFIVGREMSKQEHVALFPRLVSVYKESGGRILPVLQKIASSEVFGGGGK